MLLFLIFCAFLRTLQCASLPPPQADSSFATVGMLGPVAREASRTPDDGGQRLRTVYDIVQSRLFTIFACVWKSAHPNIDGPMDSGWIRLKRKVVITLCVVITPEVVLFWAVQQRLAAKEIAEM
ncbi:hypothetical protein D9619_010537 [Psilocybe cf. subviscida]|uniref:Secreted protein n=1 Tax=Psilocybe cf. subviscida TaxID=2480587 RepID=A0A8H5AS86_9AGAR|nr:hypothetical protein D9619_010537 [Psilocybe cf. subviscida]